MGTTRLHVNSYWALGAKVSAGILVHLLPKCHLSREKPTHCQYKFPEHHVITPPPLSFSLGH